MLYRERLLNLLNTMDSTFWKSQTHRDENFEGGVRKLTSAFKLFSWFYLLSGSSTCISFVAKPIVNGEREVPLVCWVPKDDASPYYEVVYLIQSYLLFTATTIVGGFDLFYSSMSLRYIVQFKLLRYELERLTEDGSEETARKFNQCAAHHKLLLG